MSFFMRLAGLIYLPILEKTSEEETLSILTVHYFEQCGAIKCPLQ